MSLIVDILSLPKSRLLFFHILWYSYLRVAAGVCLCLLLAVIYRLYLAPDGMTATNTNGGMALLYAHDEAGKWRRNVNNRMMAKPAYVRGA